MAKATQTKKKTTTKTNVSVSFKKPGGSGKVCPTCKRPM